MMQFFSILLFIAATEVRAKKVDHEEFRKPASVTSGTFFCSIGSFAQTLNSSARMDLKISSWMTTNCNTQLPFSVSTEGTYATICCTAK